MSSSEAALADSSLDCARASEVATGLLSAPDSSSAAGSSGSNSSSSAIGRSSQRKYETLC